MALRTVRLDDKTEKALEQVVRSTGLSMSAALAQGLLALRDRVVDAPQRAPYAIYAALDLGPGGYAVAPSTQTRHGVRRAIQRKLRKRR